MGNHRCLRRHRRPVPRPWLIQQWADAIHSDWGTSRSLDEVLHDGGDVVVVAERFAAAIVPGDDVEIRIYAAYWFEDGKVSAQKASRKVALEAAGLSEKAPTAPVSS